ncbi:MAG TPA: hypothetical protein VMW75_26240 [Thermoanaerobaculia bacterium]|nr:hypothetical protein [Thermoanaerobaculia bacterium]
MSSSRDHGARRPRSAVAGALLLAGLLRAGAAQAEIQITLQTSFVEKYKDRATIDAVFTVDKAHPRPNPPASDGDLHAAGRAPEIGLAAVAEVMNAALQPEAVALIHQAERGGQPLPLRGVWRLWCEHGGDAEHVQGQPLQPATTTNPPHVFEIHPLLRVGDLDLTGSLQPITGFAYKDAAQAFHDYEQLSSHITTADGTVTVTTRMAGFNYVELVVRLNEEPTHLLADGLSVRAAILDAAGDLLVHERRIVAAAGTAPYARLKALHKGEALHAIGIPRIDLSLLSWRVANSARLPGVLDWSLPYEIVLVAAFADTPTGPDVLPPPAAAPAAGAPGAGAPGAPGTPGTPGAGAAALPVEPVAPAIPAAPGPEGAAAEGDVVAILLRLLGQSLPAGAVRGACTFSTGQRSYCAMLAGPQCDQLGGAWNAGEDCPAPDPSLGPVTPGSPPPAPPPPPLAAPRGAATGSGPGC